MRAVAREARRRSRSTRSPRSPPWPRSRDAVDRLHATTACAATCAIRATSANQVDAVLDARPDTHRPTCRRGSRPCRRSRRCPKPPRWPPPTSASSTSCARAAARRRPRSTARRLADGAEHDLYLAFQQLDAAGRGRLRQGRLHRRAARARHRQAGGRPLLRRRDGDGRRSGHPRQPAGAAARRGADDEPRRRHLQARPIGANGPARLRRRGRRPARPSSSSSTATASSTTTATSSSSRRRSGGRFPAAWRRSRASTTPATASWSRPTSRASGAACSTWRC